MTRYILGAVAAAALALTGCNDHGRGYSGKQHNGNDTAYQNGYSATDQANNENGRGAGTSFSGVSGNGDTRHGNDFNNQKKTDENAATGQALNDDKQNPANQPAGQMMSITGTVKDSGGSSLTLVTGNKGELKLNTGDFTRIEGLNGQKIDSGDIKEGSEVRAAYKFDGKDNKAITITVTQSAKSNATDKGTLQNTDKNGKY